MAFYRPVFTSRNADEEAAYIQHHLALAAHSDVMDLARISRTREADITSSIVRYGPTRGMFQQLSPVYGEQCADASVTQQSSFDSDDRYPAQQNYRTFPDASAHVYSSPGLFESDMPSVYADNRLPTIASRPELQWITTTNTDMRTQSPLNTSSPRPLLPMYSTQQSPSNRALHLQGSLEDGPSSAATISHSQLTSSPFPAVGLSKPPSLQRSNKKSSNAPVKPKGTPGRKRKFQDHELTPAEATKRHIRRERNKVAAAKCRNRRRELTDRLQGETDHLEDHQSMLHQEILSLQQEKEHLEFILAAHSPNCKAGSLAGDSSILPQDDGVVLGGDMLAPDGMEGMMTSSHSDPNFYYMQQRPAPPQVLVMSNPHDSSHRADALYDVTTNQQISAVATDLSNRGQNFSSFSDAVDTRLNMTVDNLENLGDAPLNTPVCTLATPSLNSGTFTFPSTPSQPDFPFSQADFSQSSGRPALAPPYSASMQVSYSRPTQQSCSAAHRRSSSSESHQSPDSVKSPKLLAL